MNRPRLLPLWIATSLCTALTASAQIDVIYRLTFDNPGTPWAATGGVTVTGGTGSPTLQNTDLAPGAGNAYSAVFDGSQYQFGSTFAGLNTATTGYGVELWVKNPGSNYPSFFWLNIAAFGYPGDSGYPANENGIALGLYEGAYWGVGNSGLTGITTALPPGSAGSINGWDHLAFVADGSTGRFYVNGALIGSRTITFADPGNAWHLFAGPDGYPAFTGMADDLKLFTFATGTFNASSLDYPSAIPEPSTYAALAGAAAFALTAYRRRRLLS